MAAEFQNTGPLKVRASERLNRFLSRHLSGAKLIYDHGCGYGAWTNHIALLTGSNMAIFDPDTEAYDYTRSLLGERFSDSQGPFDAAMCFAVMELLDEAAQLDLLEKLASSVRGRVIIQYNVYNPLSLRWLAIRLSHGNPIAWHERDRFHRNYLNQRQVEALFRKAGYRVVEKSHPTLENHLPARLNNFLGPLVPSLFHMTFYYAVEKYSGSGGS